MDEENRARVKFNIELNSSFLGLVLVASESLIQKSQSFPYGSPHAKINNRIVAIEEHSASKSHSNVAKP
jgi:hypothetical protein